MCYLWLQLVSALTMVQCIVYFWFLWTMSFFHILSGNHRGHSKAYTQSCIGYAVYHHSLSTEGKDCSRQSPCCICSRWHLLFGIVNLLHWIIFCLARYFYRVTPWYMPSSCVCLSVCLSVTSRCSTEMAKHRITQTTPHNSPGTIFLMPKISAQLKLGHTQQRC